MAKDTIIVIGAGVSGLTVANTLQKRLPSHPILIIAAETPTDPNPTADYASMWAGAHYRPMPGSTRQLQHELELGRTTAEVMKQIAKDTPEAGVEVMLGVEYLETPSQEHLRLKTGDIFAGSGDGFRVFEKQELPTGITWGSEYQSYCVNVTTYTRWLLRQFQENGGRIIKHRLQDAKQAFELAEKLDVRNVRTVVNCSGRNFDHDDKTNIIRGQTVLVQQQHHTTLTRQNNDGTWSFLIPRPRGGGTIVGGTKEVGDWEARVRPDTREDLLRKAVQNFPDFVSRVEDFIVLKDNVGRRPWREGGMRIETENLSDGHRIVHGYGVGGRGYELSWGSAFKIADLVEAEQKPRSVL